MKYLNLWLKSRGEEPLTMEDAQSKTLPNLKLLCHFSAGLTSANILDVILFVAMGYCGQELSEFLVCFRMTPS